MFKTFVILFCLLCLSVSSFAAPEEDNQCTGLASANVTQIFDDGKALGQSLEVLEDLLGKALLADPDPNLCGIMVAAVENGFTQEQVLSVLFKSMTGSSGVLNDAAVMAGYDDATIAQVLYGDSNEAAAEASANEPNTTSSTVTVSNGSTSVSPF